MKQSSWQLTANAGITGCDEARRAAHATAEACCREMSSRAGGRRSALLVSTRSSSRREIAHIADASSRQHSARGATARDQVKFHKSPILAKQLTYFLSSCFLYPDTDLLRLREP